MTIFLVNKLTRISWSVLVILYSLNGSISNQSGKTESFPSLKSSFESQLQEETSGGECERIETRWMWGAIETEDYSFQEQYLDRVVDGTAISWECVDKLENASD